MTQDRARGKWDQVKGTIKEKGGKITGDRPTEASGKLDKAKGKLEETIGKAKNTIRKEDQRRR